MRTSRNSVLKLVTSIVLTLTFASIACAQTVAFTLDDGPRIGETPLMSPEARNQAMLNALAKHKVQAALFVTASNGTNQPRGYALAMAWALAGHVIGNHTMSHLDLDANQVTLAQYQQEIQDCDAIINSLPGYQKWFRYTYLHEGNTAEKREGMRKFLKDGKYRNAYVSLDTSDWRLDAKLVEVLRRDPNADLAPIKQAYLSHLRQRALSYRALSQRVQGRDIPQVMLMHHNLINAMWLDDAITMFESMGWKIVTPTEAFADPVYELAPQSPVEGQSLLLSMAKSLGLENFEGWTRLTDDADFEIEALKALGY